MQKATTNGPSRRSPGLLSLCEAADAAINVAYGTYDRKDFAAASAACLKAALQANKEDNRDWADEYGRKSAAMNKKSCGG